MRETIKTAVAACSTALGLSLVPWASLAAPLVIAPMVEGAQYCLSAVEALVQPSEAEQYCRERNESTAERLRELLSELDPNGNKDGEFVLGHTHSISLFSMLRRDGEDWLVDTDRLRYALRPVVELDRPVVLYLFSNHFGVDLQESSFEKIMMARDENLMRFPDGSLARDTYFSSEIIPWTISNLDAPVNRYRDMVLKATIDELCALPEAARSRVVAVNLLGEIHHLFPNFHSGMGFDVPMVTTDYSPPAIEAFQRFLQARYTDIATFNRHMGTNFDRFDQVEPPHKDVRTQPLGHFVEHLDAYAHGEFPIVGWAAAPNADVMVDVYLNGALVASGLANQNRQDVLQAKPELSTANVGFRFNVPFRHLPPGVHTLTVRATVDGTTVELGEREVVIMDRQQSTPGKIPRHELPKLDSRASAKGLEAWLDQPTPLQSFFFNPLADLWLQFRNRQVRDYLEHYAKIASSSCLRPEQVFIHQVAPHMNASWNHNLMAVDESLKPSPNYEVGINLYGGAAYGTHFHDWLASRQIGRYGVPEFHPMRTLSEADVRKLLVQHQQRGATYIAPYYITGIPPALWGESDHNKFRISGENKDYGSDTFYRGLRSIFTRQSATQQ